MYYIPNEMLDSFRATPVVLQALLADCTQEQAQGARGGDENWSIVEVMCHLRDSEQRGIERMRAMRDDEDPFLPAFDQDEWARERDYAHDNLREALTAYLALRKQHITELEALSPHDWQRTGRHEEE